MSTDQEKQYIKLEVGADTDIEELVIGFRDAGEFIEVASMALPAVATLEKQ